MGILKTVGKFGGIGLAVGALKGKGIGGAIGKFGGLGIAGKALGLQDKKKPTPVAGSPAAAPLADEPDAGDTSFDAAWDKLSRSDSRAAAAAAKAAPAMNGSSAESEAKRIKKIRDRRVGGGGNGLTAGRAAEPNFTKSF